MLTMDLNTVYSLSLAARTAVTIPREYSLPLGGPDTPYSVTGTGRCPVRPSYGPFANGPLNSPSDLRALPRLSVVPRNRLALLAPSFRGPLESRRAATAAYHTRRNVPASRNGPVPVGRNLPSLSANVYYYLLLLPSRLLTHLQIHSHSSAYSQVHPVTRLQHSRRPEEQPVTPPVYAALPQARRQVPQQHCSQHMDPGAWLPTDGIQAVEQHNLGRMEVECSFCRALHWIDEKLSVLFPLQYL